MKRILVTGCAGFIGSHLTEKLLERKYEVLGIDNFDPFYSRNIKERNVSLSVNHPQFQLFEGDIRDAGVLEKIEGNVDAVIHLASKVGVTHSIRYPAEYFDNNLNGTRNLLDWMQKREIKKLVFASSSSVYGNNSKKPFSENDPADKPISPYAFTKKATELLIYNNHYLFQMDALCLRFFTVYGPRQRPDLAIHKFLHLIRNGQEIPVFGDGSTARDYTFIEDTVSGVIQSLEYILKTDHVYEIINLGNNFPVALRDLIDSLYRLTGETPRLKFFPVQTGDVDVTWADITKANKILGYHPGTSLQVGLRRFIEWYDETKKNTHAT